MTMVTVLIGVTMAVRPYLQIGTHHEHPPRAYVIYNFFTWGMYTLGNPILPCLSIRSARNLRARLRDRCCRRAHGERRDVVRKKLR